MSDLPSKIVFPFFQFDELKVFFNVVSTKPPKIYKPKSLSKSSLNEDGMHHLKVQLFLQQAG